MTSLRGVQDGGGETKDEMIQAYGEERKCPCEEVQKSCKWQANER